MDTTLEPTAGDPVDAAAAPGPPPAASSPLSGTAVTEWCGAASSDVTRVAVAFAGLLAARFGSEVTRLVPPSGDPLRAWPPLNGEASAFHRFLTGGKRATSGTSTSTNSILLTDDPTLAAAHSPRTVLIRPAWGADGERVWSELTMQAASGLLDVFGAPRGRPLPMPGHQLAYSTGMAAYNALAVMLFDERAGRPVVSAEVAVLDVALWINWKHFMASIRGTPGVGLDRAEEWRSVPCLDGYVALTFQDKDVVGFAKLTGDDFFLGADLGNRATRKKRLPAFNEVFDRWAASRSRAEIVGAARKLGLPIGPVLRIEDLVSDAQINARQFLALCQDGTRIPRLPLHWNGGPLGPPNQLCTPGSEAAVNST